LLIANCYFRAPAHFSASALINTPPTTDLA
jgi:hypothetical protein